MTENQLVHTEEAVVSTEAQSLVGQIATEMGDSQLLARVAADPEYARILTEEHTANLRVGELRNSPRDSLTKAEIQEVIAYRLHKSNTRRLYEAWKGYAPPQE